MRKRFGIILALLFLLSLGSYAVSEQNAPGFTLEECKIEGQGLSFVSYPVISMDQPETAEKINAVIREEGRLEAYIALLQGLGSGGTGLQVRYEILSPAETDYLTVVLSAKGRMLEGRPSQIWYAFCFDLNTGERLRFEDLVRDTDQTVTLMEEYISERVEPVMSDYAENRTFFPLPLEKAVPGDSGVWLFYAYQQVSCLSGYSGSVLVPYHVISEQLALSLPERSPESFAAQVLESASEGSLPGIPVRLGQPLEDIVELYRSSLDPGIWQDGIFIELEDPRFFETAVCAKDEAGMVTGIFTTGALFGLSDDAMNAEEALRLFGEPDGMREILSSSPETTLMRPGMLYVYETQEVVFGFNCDEDRTVYGYYLCAKE